MVRMFLPRLVVYFVTCGGIIIAWNGGCNNMLVVAVAASGTWPLLCFSPPSFQFQSGRHRSPSSTIRHVVRRLPQRPWRTGRRRYKFLSSGGNEMNSVANCWNQLVLFAAAPRNNDDDNKDDYDSDEDSIQSPFSSGEDDDIFNPDKIINLDGQRLSLERMVTDEDDYATTRSSRSSDDSGSIRSRDGATSVILTTTRRQRLQREIQLLKQLDPSYPSTHLDETNRQFKDERDDNEPWNREERVVSELWSLWYGERGPQNEKKLGDIEMLVHGVTSAADYGDRIPPEWAEAEGQYLAMIREHCSTTATGDSIMDANNLNLSVWVEPANRLATLLFLMGRLQESKQWCERILAAKPWHIGALSGIVLICANMGDFEGVAKYSKLALPPRRNNVPTSEWIDARSEWVKRNVNLAEMNLSRLEEINKRAYGERELSNFVVDIDTEDVGMGGNSSSNDGGSATGYEDNSSSAWQ